MKIDGKRLILSKEESVNVLNWENDEVHTFRNASMILLGCHIKREQIMTYLENHDLEVLGGQARLIKHSIGCIDEHGIIAFETNELLVDELEEKANREIITNGQPK